jgi:hypothetical protein
MLDPCPNPILEPEPECVSVTVPAPLRQKDAVPQHCLRIYSGFLNPRNLQHSKIYLECDWEGTGGGGLSGLEILRRSAELFLECDLLERREKNKHQRCKRKEKAHSLNMELVYLSSMCTAVFTS